ncbi:hypothetical protein MLD38_033149 [Melastoma candidum]|uniref:Uncharacterized protein n=1 Tax=Melastoma candidum TaxID=119954 RepID=A0ACB9M831_9MYRT|nr:hypothetical protein MLD38_033149 [Melastoma candidum]
MPSTFILVINYTPLNQSIISTPRMGERFALEYHKKSHIQAIVLTASETSQCKARCSFSTMRSTKSAGGRGAATRLYHD